MSSGKGFEEVLEEVLLSWINPENAIKCVSKYTARAFCQSLYDWL
jgi:hypothetical protein